MSEKVIFFDLDGTIIDSAPQIIKSLKNAFNFFQIEPNKKISSKLIGPPVNFIIEDLIKGSNSEKAGDILKKFKYFYDNNFCHESECYKDVYETLDFLSKRNSLLLVTNKRSLPTKKIFKHKNLIKYFDDYYSVNVNNKATSSKEILLNKIIKENNLNKKKCFYVGDTCSDLISSNKNNINFIFAKWGYGEINSSKNFLIANKPSELKKFF